MKNKIIVNIIIFLTIVLSFSCNKIDSNYITIDFWGMGSEGEIVKQLIPEFERRNPGIKVKVQMIPWTAAQEKLISSFAASNTPDICQLGNTWVPQFSELNAIIPLDDFLKKDTSISKENYFDGIWDTNVLDNLVYGIPWYIDTRVMFYRKDILQKAGYDHAPRTWDELLDVSRKIKNNFGNQEKYAIYLPTNEWASFIIFGLQNNASLLKDNNTYGYFSSKEFVEAFKYLIQFHKEKLAPLGISQVNNVYQAFTDEYFSMYISGPWNISEFKKWMTGKLADKWMTSPLPGKNSFPGVSLAGGSSLVIFKNSKHKDAAWKLIKYLSESDVQLKFYELVDDLPAVKSAWEDARFKNDPYIKAFYQQFQNVVATPKIPEWEQIVFSKLQQYAELAARGAITEEEAMKKMDVDVNKILEKRRWIVQKRTEGKNG